MKKLDLMAFKERLLEEIDALMRELDEAMLGRGVLTIPGLAEAPEKLDQTRRLRKAEHETGTASRWG